MKKCIIIAAGEFYEEKIQKEKDDLLIVADAGYDNFLKLKNLSLDDIDIIIGDFDSYQLSDMKLSPKTRIIELNPIKNDSDTFDALVEGINLGYKEFYLYGVLGKRIEHTLGNLYCLAYLKDLGCNGYIIEKNKVLRVISNEKIEFSKKYKGYISIYPLGGTCEHVTASGFKYELKDFDLSYMQSTLGLDNEFDGRPASISVEKGMLLVIYCYK